ncbi:MAG: Tm-1-like ATP-binding domain-containing protein [Chloroflexi bacterium]|nr:Tm-1-like ATP-binding domain-containing protein [Chloroflexota bacterium]
MAKTIALIATLDTKGEEAQYVREQIEARGHRVVLIDPGILGDVTVPAEITRDDVARASGAASAVEIRGWGDKQRGLEQMIKGTTKIVTEMVAQGGIHGVIGIGGGAGTSIGTAVMRALPLGFPKLQVSTIAAGRFKFGTFMGIRDLTIMHSVADILGLNPIMRKVLANAAGAICGMAEVDLNIERSEKPVIFATMFGNTTPCIMHARSILVDKGYEVVVFHPNGTGGPAMEELIDQGVADGVLDLTSHEVAGEMFGGIMGAPHRLEAAARRGVPQVIGPGANDYLVMEKPEDIPPEHRHRKAFRHSREMTLLRVELQEMVQVAEEIARRVNRATGPTAVVIPLRGFSLPAREGGPLYDPEGDRAFIETLRANLAPQIKYVEVDCHINDHPYAEAAVALLEELMVRRRKEE